MITAMAAVAIGVSALFVSLYETHLVRAHQRVSVWPHLQGGIAWDGDTFRVLMVNSGIGPARVEGIRVRVDGIPVPHWTAFFQEAGIATAPFMVHQISGRVLTAGETVDVLLLSDPTMAAAAHDRWGAARIEVCYCSVFDECWILDTEPGIPHREVRACPAWGAEAFLE
jgi:hypothetical protein